MLPALIALLVCQLAGEVAVRAIGVPLPGPVLGMALMVAGFASFPRLLAAVRPVAQGLLAHLSLLFVPAGVGVIGHLDRLGAEGPAILAALVLSTLAAMAVGALVFVAVARMIGARDD
jgi:putative effector of murein hydrolase LrgA (UPF0299 family)